MFENFSKITFKYSTNQNFSSIIQMISIFKNLDIFNSKYFYFDSEKKIFCEIANFFQHFQQCLHLFCELNLLNRMKTILYDFVNTWFENQSNFIFLRKFDITLTNAFFSSVFNTTFNSNFRIFTLEFLCEIFEKSTNFCSFVSQKQQKLKATIFSLFFNFDFYDLFRDIDLFDSSLKHSNSNLKHFNEISNFLRNFEHCQHLYRYRKTHLLLFLFNCFNDSIFKWFQKQLHFDFLHIFSTALTNVFFS